MDQIRVRVWVDPVEDELRVVLTTKSKRWNLTRPYSLLHENEKSTCCSLFPPCFLPLYIESKIIPSSTIPDQEPNKIDSYYESLSLQNSHAHIRTYSQESRSEKILTYLYIHGPVLIVFGRYFFRSHYRYYSYAS